jgi:hypothetical protein
MQKKCHRSSFKNVFFWLPIKVRDSKQRKDQKLSGSIFIKGYLRPKLFRSQNVTIGPRNFKMTVMDNDEK